MPTSPVSSGKGDVALDLLGAPALRLRDDLDHGRHRVGIGLDGQHLVRMQPDPDERQHQHRHQQRRANGGSDQLGDHG
jgi:hypothetical protein